MNAHDPATPSTIQIKEGGQFVHWHGETTPVSTVFRDVRIVWRWDGNDWSQSYIPVINSGAFDLEDNDFLWVVSPRAFTITLEPEPDIRAHHCSLHGRRLRSGRVGQLSAPRPPMPHRPGRSRTMS